MGFDLPPIDVKQSEDIMQLPRLCRKIARTLSVNEIDLLASYRNFVIRSKVAKREQTLRISAPSTPGVGLA
jgi:hypothetical protein